MAYNSQLQTHDGTRNPSQLIYSNSNIRPNSQNSDRRGSSHDSNIPGPDVYGTQHINRPTTAAQNSLNIVGTNALMNRSYSAKTLDSIQQLRVTQDQKYEKHRRETIGHYKQHNDQVGAGRMRTCQSAKTLVDTQDDSQLLGREYSESSFNNLKYPLPASEHKYEPRGYAGYRKNSVKTYHEIIVSRAKKMVDPRKYSKQPDWRLEYQGFKLPKSKGQGFIDVIYKEEKRKPGPSTYKSRSVSSPRGFANVKLDKFTLIDSLAYQAKGIPGPTKYNPRPSLADISKARNVPKKIEKIVPRQEIHGKPTKAPGDKMQEHHHEANRPRSVKVVFNKEKKMSAIDKKCERFKKWPAPNHYKWESGFAKLAPLPMSMKRNRI